MLLALDPHLFQHLWIDAARYDGVDRNRLVTGNLLEVGEHGCCQLPVGRDQIEQPDLLAARPIFRAEPGSPMASRRLSGCRIMQCGDQFLQIIHQRKIGGLACQDTFENKVKL